MNQCIFCRIASKEIPSKVVYEDEHVLAFLDINPVANGHTLVIPKKHFENVFDMPEEELLHISQAVKKISEKIKKNLGAEGVNLMNASGKSAQQSVFHFHMHIIPRHSGDGLNTWPESRYKATPEELEKTASEIRK